MVGKVDLKDIFSLINRFSSQVEKDVHTMCPPTGRRPGTAPCVCRTWQNIGEVLGRVGPAYEKELVLITEIVFDEVLESVGGKGESFCRTVFSPICQMTLSDFRAVASVAVRQVIITNANIALK